MYDFYISAFVSYVGYFTKTYRLRLMDEHWLPFLKSLPVIIFICSISDAQVCKIYH